MSGLDIEAIRRRAPAVGRDNRRVEPAGVGWHGAAHASAGDVPVLLAEIERLGAGLQRAQMRVLAANQAHRDTAEALVHARMREENTAALASEVAAEMREQLAAVTAERDEALQVIELLGGAP